MNAAAVTNSPLMTSGLMYMAKSRSQALIAQASELIQETQSELSKTYSSTPAANVDGSWMDRANDQFTSLSASMFGQSKNEVPSMSGSASPSSCEAKTLNMYQHQDEKEGKDNLSAKILSHLNQGAETAADSWRAVETKLKEGAETAVEDFRTMSSNVEGTVTKLWSENQILSKTTMWPIDESNHEDSTAENQTEGLSQKFLSVFESVAEGVRRSETKWQKSVEEGVTMFRRSAEAAFDREPLDPKDVDEDEDVDDLPPEKFLATPSSYLLINDLDDSESQKPAAGRTKEDLQKKVKRKRSSKSRSEWSPNLWKENGEDLGKNLRSAVEQITPVAVWNVHREDQSPVLKKLFSLFEREDTNSMQTFDREPLYEKDLDGINNPKAIPLEAMYDFLSHDCSAPIEALAIEPLEITFPVPEDHVDGKEISFMGPHGPMSMQLGEGLVPGEVVKVRLAPAPEMTVEVPPSAMAGDIVEFEGPQGQKMRASIPFGKSPGDVFEVCPPSMCIRVPEGAKAGDFVQFKTTDGRTMAIQVPDGVLVDQYFSAII